ncbi:MAG: methyltransferase domain-containing protein [Candidatus Binatia bacterium]
MLPSTEEYERSLEAFRRRWPNDGYFHQTRRFVETYRLLRNHHAGGRIVDVGGWPGDFSCTLASLGFDVLLIDRDPDRPTGKVYDPERQHWVLGEGGTLAAKCRSYGVEVLRCDVERETIAATDGSFDSIVFTEILEHLRTSPLFALRELRRVLKPGGVLLLSTPNLLTLKNRVSFLSGRARYDTLEMPYDALEAEERIGHVGHFRIFSMPEVVDLLERTGFRIRYRGYRQIVPDREPLPPSLYALRMRLYDWVSARIPALGNQSSSPVIASNRGAVYAACDRRACLR